jgi:hypothetical protein
MIGVPVDMHELRLIDQLWPTYQQGGDRATRLWFVCCWMVFHCVLAQCVTEQNMQGFHHVLSETPSGPMWTVASAHFCWLLPTIFTTCSNHCPDFCGVSSGFNLFVGHVSLSSIFCGRFGLVSVDWWFVSRRSAAIWRAITCKMDTSPSIIGLASPKKILIPYLYQLSS